MKKPNAFTLGFCTITGEIRERSYLGQALEHKHYGRGGTPADRTEKILAFAKGSHIQIGKKADSDKRAGMLKAKI